MKVPSGWQYPTAAKGPSTSEIVAWVSRHHPHLAVEVLQGGQPLYPYLLGVESSEQRPGRDLPTP